MAGSGLAQASVTSLATGASRAGTLMSCSTLRKLFCVPRISAPASCNYYLADFGPELAFKGRVTKNILTIKPS